MMDYKMKSMEAIAEILNAYTSDVEGPWSIAYSGGKDSTVTAALVFKALLLLKPKQRTRKIYIVSSQTNLDLTTDPTKQREFKKIQKLIDKHSLPVEIAEVEAPPEKSFWYLVLGRGYPLPKNRVNKWCTDRLKIQPQNEFMKRLKPALTLLGVRKSESASRANSIEKHSMSKYYGDGTMMPIVDFTLEDVWTYLAEEKTPWGDAEELSKIYKDATGECGLSKRKAGADEDNSDACGARFGCIVCPVVKIDKSTQETAKVKPWLQPYADVRDAMIEMYKVPGNKAGYMRNGKYLGYGKGTFTVKARMKLLNLLLEAQETSKRIAEQHGAEHQPVITPELVELIQDQWRQDLKDFPHLEDAEELGEFYEVQKKGVSGTYFQLVWNEEFANG